MAANSPLGRILNKSASIPRITAEFSTAATYLPGLVYEAGAGDWRQAPTDGSKEARELYWLENGFTVATGEVKKTTVYALPGLMVIGTSDGIIAPDSHVMASTNVAGALLAEVWDGTSSVTAVATGTDICGKYLGKEDEIREGQVVRSSSADTDTDCVFVLGGI